LAIVLLFVQGKGFGTIDLNMRIGVFDPYLDDMGGGEKYMLTIAQCLSSDNEVVLFWDNQEDLKKATERFSVDLSKIRIAKNIFSPQFGLLKRLLETKKYDAIIIISDGSIPFVLSKKLFIHIQQPIPNAKSDFKTRIKIKRIRKVFCNSYFTKSFVDKDFGVESLVVYPPIVLKPKKEKKENIILHVGRFRVKNIAIGDYKKQGVMIKAFKSILKKGLQNWRFVLAVSIRDRDYEEFSKMKKETKGFPIEFLINKSNDELWDIYSRAKIYWHAAGFGEDLETHPEYAEHFGISTVEAMGAGAVPVVINAGGQKEIIEDGKNGLLWNTLSELQEKTLMLTREDKILEKMSKEAKKRANDFAGKRFCEEIKKIIEND